MNLSFVPLEGKSRNYKLLLAILGALVLLGLASFIVSYIEGHQVFGSNNAVPWGMLIFLFIYCIGLSAGSLILSSITYVFGREEYKPIARVAVYLAILLIFAALLFIAVDLGRPEKFWRLFMFFFLNNMTSMFAINGVLYSVYMVLSVIYFMFILANNTKYTRILGIIAVIWAIMVHTGTGCIWGFISTREIYASPIKPFEFLTAAITSGMALLILVVTGTLKFSKRIINNDLIFNLSKMLRIALIVLLVMVFFDKLTHIYLPPREGTLFLFSGPYWWLFWILQIGMGIVIPLIILFNPGTGKSMKWVLTGCASVVIGVLGERAALAIPGLAEVQQLYPGNIEGVWGAVGTYSITYWEVTLSIGVLALVAFLFVLGLRYLELLPVTEQPQPSESSEAESSEIGSGEVVASEATA
jgi:molybdopterin-containing oxidoreductase family membrane subunit